MIRRRSRHLGDLAAALVDGELGHDARDRALGHLAICSACRDEVAAQRRLKGRLRGLAEPPVDPGLAAALREVGDGRAVPQRRRPRLRAPRHRLRLAAAGGLTLTAATLGTALLAGGAADAPTVRPPVDRFVVEHLATTDQLPLTGPDVGAAATVATNPVP